MTEYISSLRKMETVAEKRDNKGFWNRCAKLYDFEIDCFSGKAYAEMYRMMANSLLPDMDVLEVATGTGLIAIISKK